MTNKPKLSFWQIINMNVGFFGIQYSFGLQQSAVNPIYDFLGAKPDEIPWLNLAGPLTGLLIQPIIGALSDRTWHPKFGRRKPYFFIGAIMCSLALFAFPFSSSLWMAAGLLWILDAGNNTAMEPYRAFVADKLDPSQQPTGFQAQSFFTGFGQTLANLSLFIFPMIILGKTGAIPNWVFGSFILGGICSIGSVWWSMKTTPEIPPTSEEIAEMKSKPLNLLSPFIDVGKAIGSMPKVMWLLALVYLFQWYALFCYWQNSSKAVAQNAFSWHTANNNENKIKKTFNNFTDTLKLYANNNKLNIDSIKKTDSTYSLLYNNWKDKAAITSSLNNDEINMLGSIENNDKKYENAVSWTGLVNAWYNVVTFLVAFGLVWLARKYSPKSVHIFCLILSGIGFIAFSYVQNKWLFFPAITGFGIGWASMMGIPYLMIVSEIPKEKYGVYMGIINMMIVIPMFIQTITFGYIMKHFLNNDSTNAIFFAGVLLLIAAAATLLIKSKKLTPEIMAAPTTGGH
jgi:maltose/moltooligosaccharide transporter